MERTDPPDGGVILIEILVALSIIAVMGAMMAGVLGQLRSVSQTKEQILAQAELSAAASHIQRTLAGARKAKLPDNEEDENHMLDGGASEVRFATITRQGFYSLALRDVRLSLESNADDTRLVQTLSPRRPEKTEDEELPETKIVILGNVQSLSFEYSGDGDIYSSSWNKDGELPDTIRVTIGRQVAGRPVSATAVARLH